MKTDMLKKVIAGLACASMLAVTIAEAGAPPFMGNAKLNGAAVSECENTQDCDDEKCSAFTADDTSDPDNGGGGEKKLPTDNGEKHSTYIID